jgi:outer membrane receptor for ferrienterochelin and colicins
MNKPRRAYRLSLKGAAPLCSLLARRAFQVLALSLALGAPAAEVSPTPKPPDLTELPLEALMNLEVPKVYAASKIEQDETQAPASVTIVTADEIKKYGQRTLADVLRSVQGFNISYDRNYAFLGARGLSLGDFNDRILVLVDGHRVNNNYNDGAFIDTAFPLDLDLVDRVEVVRGPGSVLYGNNAFFGVVNVVTRQGRSLNGFEASGAYASFDSYKARLTYGKSFTNGLQMLLSGTFYDSGGQDQLFYKEFLYENHGVAEKMDGDGSSSLFGSLAYADFTLEGAFNRREKVNPTAQFSTTFNDPHLRTTDERDYTFLKYAHSFPEVVDVTARVYYDRYRGEIGYPYFPAVIQETDLGEWWGSELQLSKRLWDRHLITLGAEYRDDFQQNSQVFDQSKTYSNTHTNRQSYGVYAQADFAVRTNLHFNGGLRYDQYADFDPALNPRLALIYNPWETSAFKAIYGTAFRAPSFYEISSSAQPLQPEEITAYELVYEQQIGRHLRSSLSGFYNQLNDLIVFDSGTFTNFNADTRGLELALEGFWASGLRGRASYSFQDTRNSTVPWAMPDSPNHLFKFNLIVPLVSKKVFAGLEYQFTSNRRSLHSTTDQDGQPITVQGVDAAGFGIFNLTLFSQNLLKNLEASVSVYNLLDRKYSDPASHFHIQDTIDQDGRNFRLKLTYRF